MQELDDLIAILEAQAPANPRSPENERLAREFEKDLRDYFNKLENAMPMGKIEALYRRRVKDD